VNEDELKEIEKNPFDALVNFFIGVADNEILLISSIMMLVLFIIFIRLMVRSYLRAIGDVSEVSNYIKELEQKSLGNNSKDNDKETYAKKMIFIAKNITNKKNSFSHELSVLQKNIIFIGDNAAPLLPAGLTRELFEASRIEAMRIPTGTINRGSLFITLGVFGTFLGLTMGVSQASDGLASTDIMLARQAMGDLLGGAELAFITSLLGLVMTVFYNEVLSAYRKKLSQASGDLLSILDHGFLPVNTALISAMQVKSLSADISNLNNTILNCNKILSELRGIMNSNNVIVSDGFKSMKTQGDYLIVSFRDAISHKKEIINENQELSSQSGEK